MSSHLPAMVILSLLVLSATASIAVAHDGRPLYVEVNEIDENNYEVRLKIPASVPTGGVLHLSFPNDCESDGVPTEFAGGDGVTWRAVYDCEEALVGRDIRINFSGQKLPISTIVAYREITGKRHTGMLAPDETRWRVPHSESTPQVASQYVRYGTTHILKGADHLLFLVCLLWMGGSRRRTIITISGFTLGHSVTLVLSVLGEIRVPIEPVEASIALSIVFMAAEITKGPRNNLAWRFPVASASAFGLLHGLGFAGALDDIGFPRGEVFTALLFFNVGVELGQIMFVSCVLLLVRMVALARENWPELGFSTARVVIGYLVGIVAVHWFIQRVVLCMYPLPLY